MCARGIFTKERIMPADKEIKSKESVYAYKIKKSIYVNTTMLCSNVCEFCIKFFNHGVAGYDLMIASDPGIAETCTQIDSLISDEIESLVFCGLGESTYRLDFMEEIALRYKARGLSIRLNTNGHGNLINRCNIIPKLEKFVDSISISLNAQNEALYNKLCNPAFDNAYNEMLNFTRYCVGRIKEVWLTAIEMPEVDVKECEKIAKSIGAKFRVRPYIPPVKIEKCEGGECIH